MSKVKELLESLDGEKVNEGVLYRESRRPLSSYEAGVLTRAMVAFLTNNTRDMRKDMVSSGSRADAVRNILGIPLPVLYDDAFDYEAQKEAESRVLDRLFAAVLKAVKTIKPLETAETHDL